MPDSPEVLRLKSANRRIASAVLDLEREEQFFTTESVTDHLPKQSKLRLITEAAVQNLLLRLARHNVLDTTWEGEGLNGQGSRVFWVTEDGRGLLENVQPTRPEQALDSMRWRISRAVGYTAAVLSGKS